jgi:hypothetical protein
MKININLLILFILIPGQLEYYYKYLEDAAINVSND